MNGNILRKLRKEHGLTQRELADMADVHITTIKRIENGATTQSHAPNIRKLAKAFGVAPDYLLQEITPTLTGLNHFFGTIPAQLIGRQDELDTVNRALSSPNGPQVITLTGHRGVGKTAIASTVAQKAQSILGFQSVIWTSGKSEELEPRGITRVGAPPLSPADITHAIGAAFGQDNIGIHPLTEQEHIAINLLSKQPVLLVVDNLDGLSKDDLDLLASFMQRLPYNTRVLATGLCPLGIKNEAIVRISPLSVEDACVLVSREAALKQVELSSTDALAIYKSVGGIPVLLIWCVGRMALESQSTEIV